MLTILSSVVDNIGHYSRNQFDLCPPQYLLRFGLVWFGLMAYQPF